MRKNNATHITLMLLAIAAALGLLAYSIFGDRGRRDIIGTWVVERDGVETGFQCAANGIAASIYMPTRQYSNWEMNRKRLVLKGKLFEGRRVYDIADTLPVRRLTSKTLFVETDSGTVQYKKIR